MSEMTRVFHIGGPLSQKVGGPYYTVQNLCNHLAKKSDFEIAYIGNQSDSDLFFDREKVSYYTLSEKTDISDSYRTLDEIKEQVKTFDICHSHGVWHKANRIADRLAKDMIHVVTPRGMLLKWAFNHKRWKKQLAWWLYQKKILQTASCLHATSEEEAEELRNLGLETPIAVIPNGVMVPAAKEGNSRDCIDQKWPELKSKRLLLFISRIHKKKGLDMLAEIWGNLSNRYPEWKLVIAGPDETDYWKIIENKIIENDSIGSVLYVGPQYGEYKDKLLEVCEIFVLPTYSENFGIAVAEALAFGKPVVTTTGAPWNDLLEYECGWWVDSEVGALRKALTTALDTDSELLEKIGRRGKQLIADKYSWNSIADQVQQLYQWLQTRENTPDFIWN